MKTVKVVQPPDPAEEVPAEVLAQAILDISEGMKKLNGSKLKRRAIVLLIHDQSKVSCSNINLVLDSLDTLKETWIKS